VIEQEAGELRGVVPDDAMLLKKIAGQEFNAEAGDTLGIEADLLGALGAITPGDLRRDGLAIGDDVVDEVPAHVILNDANVLAEGVVRGLAGLGHEIGDVNTRGSGASDRTSDFGNQEIGENTGVEGTGAHEDEVGFVDGLDGGSEGADAARDEFEFANGLGAARDPGLSFDALAVREGGDEMNVGSGGRKDAAANGEDFRGDANGLRKIAGDVSERGEKEITEVVAAEPASSLETILKEAAEEGFVFGESDHAVPDVARRKNAIFAAKTPGTAAVVGDGDDGSKIGDGASESRLLIAAANDVVFEPAKESGKSGATAESDNGKGARRPLRFARTFHGRLECLREL